MLTAASWASCPACLATMSAAAAAGGPDSTAAAGACGLPGPTVLAVPLRLVSPGCRDLASMDADRLARGLAAAVFASWPLGKSAARLAGSNATPPSGALRFGSGGFAACNSNQAFGKKANALLQQQLQERWAWNHLKDAAQLL